MKFAQWLRQRRINFLLAKIAKHEARAEFLSRVTPLLALSIAEHLGIVAEMRERVRQLRERAAK